jgi:hypothetical protein
MVSRVRFLGRFAGAAVLACALMSPAHAILMSTNDVLTLNFDFSGATPAPPYGRHRR